MFVGNRGNVLEMGKGVFRIKVKTKNVRQFCQFWTIRRKEEPGQLGNILHFLETG